MGIVPSWLLFFLKTGCRTCTELSVVCAETFVLKIYLILILVAAHLSWYRHVYDISIYHSLWNTINAKKHWPDLAVNHLLSWALQNRFFYALNTLYVHFLQLQGIYLSPSMFHNLKPGG